MSMTMNMVTWIAASILIATGSCVAAETTIGAYQGIWIVEAKSPQGVIWSLVNIDDGEKGWYGLPDTEHQYPLRDVALDNGEISFGMTVYIDPMGAKMSFDFRGLIRGDTIEGKLLFPGSTAEAADVKGTRATEEDIANFLLRVEAEGTFVIPAIREATPAPSGDYAVSMSVRKFSGESVAGQSYLFQYEVLGKEPFTISEGIVPTSGVLEFEGLAASQGETAYYILSVADSAVNKDSSRNSFFLTGEEKRRHMEVVLPCIEGDQAPNIVVIDVETKERVNLEDYYGQVVFLDFWATWCPPCQEPMARNNELLALREDWKGKATILAISLDNLPDEPREHMAKRDWSNLRNLWAPVDEETHFPMETEAAKAYGVRLIPMTILIDQNGIVRARGNDLEPESLIDALLGG